MVLRSGLPFVLVGLVISPLRTASGQEVLAQSICAVNSKVDKSGTFVATEGETTSKNGVKVKFRACVKEDGPGCAAVSYAYETKALLSLEASDVIKFFVKGIVSKDPTADDATFYLLGRRIRSSWITVETQKVEPLPTGVRLGLAKALTLQGGKPVDILEFKGTDGFATLLKPRGRQ